MSLRATPVRDFVGSLCGFDWSELRDASACGHWPGAVYIVICMGSAMLVLLLCGLVLLPGLNASWQTAREQSAALAFERNALRRQVNLQLARNVTASHLCVLCPTLHGRLRPAESMPFVLDRLNSAAAAHGLSIDTLRPELSWQQLPLHAYEIDVQVSTDKHQLAGFMTDIEALPFALAVQQADWQLASSHARLTLFLLVDDTGWAQDTGRSGIAGYVDEEVAGTGFADTDLQSTDAGWQRVAFIQRGNQFLEVLRDTRGELRQRDGVVTEVSQ